MVILYPAHPNLEHLWPALHFSGPGGFCALSKFLGPAVLFSSLAGGLRRAVSDSR